MKLKKNKKTKRFEEYSVDVRFANKSDKKKLMKFLKYEFGIMPYPNNMGDNVSMHETTRSYKTRSEY